ncbi:hypothetical protein M0813_09524 [Anaeramoeba flamelloides]|uniref:MULE transposase domain-containing protein n=1 Tax=Anaeramoeba flamelloides TaxID=1746091 RepID=A0ABQ8X4N4_9EUKA|nr:hypothetical protein M0813_09524 [Anaeramoeba flamelloides]
MNVLLENCLKTIEELTKKIASLENEKLQQKPTMDDSKTENTNIEILTNKISNLSVQKKKYENSENLYINSENSQFDKEINLKDNKVQLVFENNFLQIEKLKRVFYKEKNIILCFAKKKLVENKEGNLVMYLGCPENKCLSKGVLRCVNKNGKLIYVLSIKGAHCHMNSKTNFELSVLDEIKIIEDLSKTSLSPEQIVLQIKKNRSEGLIKNDGILCESSEDIKKRVYKFRKKKEKFVDSNLILNEELSKTEKNTPFIRLDIKGDFPLILMATNQQLSLLTNNNQIFVDGTYLVCPREYTSLYTIMTFDNETQMYIPCIWGLVTDETTPTVLTFLNYAKRLVERILKNFKWNPSVINLDFAKSNINAIKITFPFSKVHGCGFHFLQAIKRKLMKSKSKTKKKF